MRLIDADAFKEYVNISDAEIYSSVMEALDGPRKQKHAFEAAKAVRDGFLQDIDEQPTVEAVPVVHANWEEYEEYDGYLRCSNCHEWPRTDSKWNYCPICGAKMDKEVQDDG